MAQICVQCGKKIGVFSNSYLSIGDDYVLCYGCLEPIKSDFISLYRVDNFDEFNAIKKRILEYSIKNYNKKVNGEIQKHLNFYQDKVAKKLRDYSAETNSEETYSEETYSANSNIASFENEDISSTELNNNAEELRVTSDSIGMFGNIGGKIKTLAQVVTWIGIIGSVIYGFVLGIYEDLIFEGFIMALLGSLISWVSSFVLYGFGQLIENTDKLVELAKNKKSD